MWEPRKADRSSLMPRELAARGGTASRIRPMVERRDPTSITNPREARRVLEKRARARGFDLVGVTGAGPLTRGGERLREWQEAGMAADMGYMRRPVGLLSEPKRLQKRSLPKNRGFGIRTLTLTSMGNSLSSA